MPRIADTTTRSTATDEPADASPFFGVTLPEGYPQWPLIALALEGEPLG